MSAPRRPRHRAWRCLFWTVVGLPYMVSLLVLGTMVLRPSYTHRPAHYNDLQARMTGSEELGRGNVNNEKVFIATSIYDDEGALVGGAWGQALLDLVDILGPDNVHLSVYENDPDPISRMALETFEKKVHCNSSIVAEHLPLDEVRRVALPNGEKRIKRIAYLAEVRNRALRPLETSEVRFDKILFINDVYFNPADAAQLLFSTNVDEDTGRTDYRAACAVDFINPFKFYDTFATRDLQGHSMGLPFFPFFPNAGNGTSRNDVVNQKDAVRVRSCWGGMVSYEAKWFQDSEDISNADPKDGSAWGLAVSKGRTDLLSSSNSTAIRFRFENRTYWDASECCLINADIQRPRDPADPHAPSGIYLNPYIRTAYDEYTLSWLSLTRRPERLYSLIHDILNRAVGMPGPNKYRYDEPGTEVTQRIWKVGAGNDTGAYEDTKIIAAPGSFCGSRKLLVLGEKEGESKWQRLEAPPE
ncbi:glycosyltransferase family 69 protein [Saccharata proteae CBS 121410]|uniref:Glycosyltransferase family 69 protein n=1 Tax=Saccharata proteae CBS 121410 TaxID=1314787 RepID=A0A9P4HSK4_9PEZI|nr:glycosyltransferase family 69 protein [Saccharata proteae CBS 121410]